MENKRVLFLAASPWDKARIGFDAEYRQIKQVLRQSNLREQFEFELSLSVKIEDIQQEIIQFKPQVIHFSGHGKESALAFSNAEEKVDWVDIETLRGLFEIIATHVECVVLNACYSETQAQIIAQYIDYVIGMEIKIGDIAAEKFSTGFYTALFNGNDYLTAYKQGKEAIRLAGLKAQVEIPKLKQRRQTFIPSFKHDIFISFADADKEWANSLTDYLRKKLKLNLKLFDNDFQIYSGNDLSQLEQSATLLVIASSAYCQQYQAQLNLLKQQNKIFFIEKEPCNPRPEALKGFVPTKFWRYDDSEGMVFFNGGGDYFVQADKLANEVSNALLELKNQYQYQQQIAQKRQQQQESRPATTKNIDAFVFLHSAPEDLDLSAKIVPLLEENGIDYVLPLKRSDNLSATDIRLDIENNILNCDAVLVLYEHTTPVWVREQLGVCRRLQRKRDNPLKIIAVHKNQEKPDLDFKIENLHVYLCPPQQIETYLAEFIEALA